MQVDNYAEAKELIEKAIQALQMNDRSSARNFAIRSAMLNPNIETPWLILASFASPKTSISCLKRALEINPDSQTARKGLHWAIKRQRTEVEIAPPALPVIVEKVYAESKNVWKINWITQILKRLASSFFILILIAFITFIGLFLAKQGREGIPVTFFGTLSNTIENLINYIFHHPDSYYWQKENIPTIKLVGEMFINSAGLLFTSLILATFLGGLAGIIAAQFKNRNTAPLMLIISILGISLPSFLFAMLLWVLDFQMMRWFNLRVAIFPPIGFGWDLHMVMPVLVLAARPTAQIMQMTYINTSEVLQEDFIRVVKAKGASQRLLLYRHTLRNMLIPILTTMAASLRFSLASLPVVESFFLWPGLGLGILQAIQLDNINLVTDLTVLLGTFFLLINLVLDFLYPFIDPRLRKQNLTSEETGESYQTDGITGSVVEIFKNWGIDFYAWLKSPLSSFTLFNKNKLNKQPQPDSGSITASNPGTRKMESPDQHEKISLQKTILSNLPLTVGTILAMGLLILVVFGPQFAHANPYETHGTMMIEGKIQAPPFAPSSVFPWGSDLIGRDIQALVLAGARETLLLALLATIARVLLGTFLGVLSGWWFNSWLDRVISAAISVWSAFPETIFAMLLILALGIQEGRWVFIVALCLVSWGQIAQLIRSQVISQKPLLHIEAARSEGARPDQILTRHIIPFLTPTVLILIVMEMGGVLMLLAELGFLNIFLGGGFKALIAEGAGMTPIYYNFSDIPEWGALLANIRDWWRSYPWLAWYPGIFFFASIFIFNLWGEGLRRFITEARINLNKIINRYTLFGGALVILLITFGLKANSPLELYKDHVKTFDTNRAMQHIEVLSSDEYFGRESGTGSAIQSAEYIADQMEEIGLFPVENYSYFLKSNVIYNHLAATPKFIVSGLPPAIYREDFVEFTTAGQAFGTASGNLIAVALSDDTESYSLSAFKNNDEAILDSVILLREKDFYKINVNSAKGILIIAEDDSSMQKRTLYPPERILTLQQTRLRYVPTLMITPDYAEILLKQMGSSLSDLDLLAENTPVNFIGSTSPGPATDIEVVGSGMDDIVEDYEVVGIIPGTGSLQKNKSGASLDSQLIMVSAYYDGLGTGPDGTVYPGANDNASGVAAMLEMARVLKNSPYKPEKTIAFVAWSGAERGQGFSIKNITNATTSFNGMTVEAVLELSGMGAGTGNGISLDQGTSYRLFQVFDDAAKVMDLPLTTRGRGPHFSFVNHEGFGGRSALSAYVSWDGSDYNVHTSQDNFQNISAEKLTKSSETTLLALTYISREPDY